MAHRLILLLAALCWAAPAEAAPIGAALVAGVGAAVGGATAAAIATQAIFAGVLAGVQMALQKKPEKPGPRGSDITLNKIQPVTTGLIVYGERTVGGSIVARSTTAVGGKPHKRYHSVLTLACHEIEGAQEIWIGETLVWTRAQYETDIAAGVEGPLAGQVAGDYRGKVRLVVRDGAADQAAVDRYVSQAGEWTEHHRGRGIAYVYFESDYDRDLFPRGVPELRVRLRGKRVLDPRDGQVKWTANPFLALRDYALTPEFFGGIGWTADDLDDAAIVAHANIADEAVPLAGGGTEARYAFSGALDTADSPRANLDQLSAAWGGWWAYDRGRLTVGGAAWEEPAVEITEDMLVAPIRVRARRPFEEQFNTVKAQFADAAAEHVATDLPVLSSAAYRAEDNGEELVRDLEELPGETSHARGQRLMKLALLKGRRQKRVELPCSLAAWNVRLGDNVRVTIPRRGWTQKNFEVLARRVRVAPDGVGITLTCIETGPAIFDWTTSEETPKPAGGVPSLPSPTAKPMMQAPAMAEELYETRGGGGVKTRVQLSTDTDNPFVTTWQFAWQWVDGIATAILGEGPALAPLAAGAALGDAAAWGAYATAEIDGTAPSLAPLAAGAAVGDAAAWGAYSSVAQTDLRTDAPVVRPLVDVGQDLLEDVRPGIYVFGVRGRTARGLWSDWTWSGAVAVLGEAAPPAALSGLTAQAAGVALLHWTQHPSLDVRQGGRIEFRHASAMAGASWQNSTSIGRAVPGVATEAALPLKSGTYLARPYDATGLPGPEAAVVVRAASILPTATVASLVEAPGFAGIKAGCSVELGALVIDPGGTEAVYGFAGSIDLGAVQPVRLVGDVTVTFTEREDLFWKPDDAAMWLPGDAPMWLGDAASGDVDMQVSATDDDPAGSPSWGPWQSFDAADFEARAFRFRAVLSVESAAYVASVSALTVTAQQAA
ncbi:hypothetical protein SAMN05444722_1680 [Rhodovulum sp. ES.010]|uniref:hypothetical protein n=1 Tax=Rhodovulum sp. ES.010 TaxID=1882821 RepID=UPI000927ABC2|nr:hypothetical protein [Rhodovulum sp. ES.010]SIO36334.1 hypothetical protein SAMN05444722_1680 [Rhodovulum sp. ES.010]